MKIKYWLLLSLVCLGFSTAQAQIKAGANVGVQLPIGTFSDDCKVGWGFTANGKYYLNRQMNVGASLGFTSFMSKPGGISPSYTFRMIPFNVSYEYFYLQDKVKLMDDMLKPYVSADLGLYYVKAGVEGSSSQIKFGFSPAIGAIYQINKFIDINANVKFNYVATSPGSSTFMGINVGVLYTIAK